VRAGDSSFFDATLEWYDDVQSLDRWLVQSGPDEWPRIADTSITARPRILEGGTVSNLVVDDHRIEFDTTAVGMPHLVKVSYFPNWSADGADGPYRAAPSLMIVVPTEEHVVITFEDTWAEHAGRWLTALTLIGLIGVAVRKRVRGREDVVSV